MACSFTWTIEKISPHKLNLRYLSPTVNIPLYQQAAKIGNATPVSVHLTLRSSWIAEGVSINGVDEAASIDGAEDGQIRESVAFLEVFPRQKAGVFKQCCSSLGLQPTGSCRALSGEEEKTRQASMNANSLGVSRRHLDVARKRSRPQGAGVWCGNL